MPKLTKSQKEHVAALKKMGEELYVLGWKKMRCIYAGYSDSLDTAAIKLVNADGTVDADNVAASALPPDFSTDTTLNHFLELLPDGFENNEGSSGDITIDTRTGKITVLHTEYFTDEKNHKWVL